MQVNKKMKFGDYSKLGDILFMPDTPKEQKPVAKNELNSQLKKPYPVQDILEEKVSAKTVKSKYQYEAMPSDSVREKIEADKKYAVHKDWNIDEAKKWYNLLSNKNISQADLCKMISDKQNISITQALNFVNAKEQVGYIQKFLLDGAYYYMFNYDVVYLDEYKEEEAAILIYDFGKTKKEVFDILNNFEFTQRRELVF